MSYNASSPDEEALVKGAAKFGFKFVGRTQTDVQVIKDDWEWNALGVDLYN
jgi:magnesium-transporting ATPase (P-type)